MGIGGKTMQEACEAIAYSRILTNDKGKNPTAEQVFKYSPTGELFMIWEWYEAAEKCVEHDKICSDCREARKTGVMLDGPCRVARKELD